MNYKVLEQFQLDSPAVSSDRYGCGHINETYLVVTESGRRYILQKISNRAFPDVAGLQENIAAVTRYLHTQITNPYGALTLIPTLDGKDYYHAGENSDWRVYDFIEGSLCLQAPETPEDFYQSAIAFGTFQQQLAGFPAETLHETIKNFHNTPDRFRIFKEVLARDVMGRAKDVQPEIDFVLAHEEIGGKLMAMLKAGELPLRVTHNDTKLNNVMLDEVTGDGVCVIDLDTVMPGSLLYDYGDALRFGGSSGAEDEKDLDKIYFVVENFEAFTRGFLETLPSITEEEIKLLPFSIKLMTLECGSRFLADYLNGDVYFKVHREGHNLDRCRTQFKLVKDIEDKMDELNAIVAKIAAEVKNA